MSTGTLDGPTDLPVFSCDISVSISLHVAGKIKKLLHVGLYKYTIGLLGALGISFSNFFTNISYCWN